MVTSIYTLFFFQQPLFLNTDLAFSDGLLVILFTLFVASTVNERIIDFIKLRFPTLWLKAVNPKDEIVRHQRLWLIAFGMGVVTTGLLDMNLVKVMAENDPLPNLKGFLDWLILYKDEWYVIVLGYLFTALFISLGAKFWHDLLDIVLFVKKSKRKLEEINLEGVEDIKQIKKYFEENDYEVAIKALAANRELLEKKYGTDSLYLGYEHVRGQYRWAIVAMIRTKSKKEEAYSVRQTTFIDYVTNYGYVFKFPVLLRYPGLARTANEEEGAEVVAGGGLFNSSTPKNVGTFGCIVREVNNQCQDSLLLTCWHCIRIPEKHGTERIDLRCEDREVRYKANAKDTIMPIVGEVQRAYRNGRMDVAIIKPKSNDLIRDHLNAAGQLIPKGSRVVTKQDIVDKTRVWFSGARSGNCEGFIIHFNCILPIEYSKNEPPYKIRNLIAFSQHKAGPHKRPCERGDSGTIILEADTYKALGMIVAIDEEFGYAIPISDILTTNELVLFNAPCIPPSS